MLRNNQPYLNLKLLRSDKCRKQTIRIFSLVAYYPSWDEEDHWCLPQSFLTKTVTIFLGALVCSSPWTFWGPLPLALVWIENRFHPNLDRARKMFSPIDTITAQQICLLWFLSARNSGSPMPNELIGQQIILLLAWQLLQTMPASFVTQGLGNKWRNHLRLTRSMNVIIKLTKQFPWNWTHIPLKTLICKICGKCSFTALKT